MEIFGQVVVQLRIIDGANLVVDTEFVAIAKLEFEDIFNKVIESSSGRVYDET